MRGFATMAMLVLAVSGLSACSRNKAANNSATATNNSAAAVPKAPAAAPAPVATVSPADARATLIQVCQQEARNNPSIPAGAGAELAAACGCAYDGAFGTRPDLVAYAASPAGQQAFAQSLTQCLGVSPGGAAGAADEGEGEEGEE